MRCSYYNDNDGLFQITYKDRKEINNIKYFIIQDKTLKKYKISKISIHKIHLKNNYINSAFMNVNANKK